MSDSHFGLDSERVRNQWSVDTDTNTKESKTLNSNYKAHVFQDQVSHAGTQKTRSSESVYVQDFKYPKLREPVPPGKTTYSNSSGGSSSILFDPEPASTEYIQAYTPAGESRVPLEKMTQGQTPLNQQGVEQFAKDRGLSPEEVRAAFFFAQAHPEQTLTPPFNEIQKYVHQESLTNPEQKELEGQHFEKLLQGETTSEDIQKLAEKLGVPEEEVREMVRQSYKQELDGQLPLSNEEKILRQDAQKVPLLAQQLGISPEEAKKLIEAMKNPPLSPELTAEIQQIANKLHLLPKHITFLIQQAFPQATQPSESSDKLPHSLDEIPEDVKELTVSLQQKASDTALQTRENQAFNRALFSADAQVEQLSKQLQMPSKEVRLILLKLRDDPTVPSPPALQEFAQSLTEAAKKLLQEPQLDTGNAFQELLNKENTPAQKKILALSKRLNMPLDQVKEMLIQGFKNPAARSIPLPILRLANELCVEATTVTQKNALAQLTGQIFDAKVASEEALVADFATTINVSLEQAQLLTQEAAANSTIDASPAQKTADELKIKSFYEASARLNSAPSSSDVDAVFGHEYDKRFEQRLGEMDISLQQENKVKFAKQHPELRGALDRKVIQAFDEADAFAKASLEKQYGIPRTYTPRALANYQADISSQIYDTLFEEELAKLRNKNKLSIQETMQLRQLHYRPDEPSTASLSTKELSKHIDTKIISKTNASVDAPGNWKPIPGSDSFSALTQADVNLESDKSLDKMEETGEIDSQQKEQVKKSLNQGSPPSPEIQPIIERAVVEGNKSVSSKYGIDISSVQANGLFPSKDRDPNTSNIVRSSVHLGDEIVEAHQRVLDSMPPDTADRPVYTEYLLITRTALQAMKEYLFMENSGDSERAKKLAVMQLEMQMNKLNRLKEALIEREKMQEKATILKIIVIIMMVVMIVVLTILTIVAAFTAPPVAVVLGISLAIEIINLGLFASDTKGSEVFGYFALAIEVILGIVLIVITWGAATPFISAWVAAKALYTAGQLTFGLAAKFVLAAIKEMIDILIKAVKEAVEAALNAIKKMIAFVKKAVTKVMAQTKQKMIDAINQAGKQIVQKVADGIQELIRLKDKTCDSFRKAMKAMCDSIEKLLRQPLSTLRKWADELVDIIKNIPQKSREFLTDPTTAQKIESLGKITSQTSQATQQIVNAKRREIATESQAINTMLDAWLEATEEVLTFLKRFISSLIAAMQIPVEWIAALTQEQAQYWSKMSSISTGLASV